MSTATSTLTTSAGRVPARDAELGQWVEAAPFRAHLSHLMAAGAMSSDMVAVLAGISPALARRLLTGRGGRALRRISPLTAAKLYQVTPQLVRSARRRPVPAGDAVARLQRLRAAGRTDGELAELVGLSSLALAELLTGRSSRCSQWVALRLAAEELRQPARYAPGTAAGRAA